MKLKKNIYIYIINKRCAYRMTVLEEEVDFSRDRKQKKVEVSICCKSEARSKQIGNS